MKSLYELGDWKPSAAQLTGASQAMLEERVKQSVEAGLYPAEAGESALSLFALAHRHLLELLQIRRVPQHEMDHIALGLSAIVAVTYSVASRDPESFRALRTSELDKHLKAARARKASKALPASEVQRVILEKFSDKALIKRATTNGQKAERVFEAVNGCLAALAKRFGVKPIQYRDPDSLRRRYEAILRRTAE